MNVDAWNGYLNDGGHNATTNFGHEVTDPGKHKIKWTKSGLIVLTPARKKAMRQANAAMHSKDLHKFLTLTQKPIADYLPVYKFDPKLVVTGWADAYKNMEYWQEQTDKAASSYNKTVLNKKVRKPLTIKAVKGGKIKLLLALSLLSWPGFICARLGVKLKGKQAEREEKSKNMKKISIIVPCYNEEAALPLFYPVAHEVLEKLPDDYELIFVNDGSKDKTLEILRDLAAKDPHVFYISFSRNFGKEAAMYAGFVNASGDYVAVMDADLQDPPALLPEMIKILDSGEYDSVATRREDRKGEPPVRSWFARKFYQIINNISDADVVDGARDFRLMKRDMVDAIVEMSEYNRFSKGIFGWVGFKTYWLPYENVERVAGESKWNFWKLFKYAIDGIINFSLVPLNLSSWMGFLMTGVSFIMLIVIVLRKLIKGDPVAGWASLICVVIFIGGLVMLSLGVMGQYLAKIYMESKRRPHYISSESNIKDVKKID